MMTINRLPRSQRPRELGFFAAVGAGTLVVGMFDSKISHPHWSGRINPVVQAAHIFASGYEVAVSH
jgi:hypothetical protein